MFWLPCCQVLRQGELNLDFCSLEMLSSMAPWLFVPPALFLLHNLRQQNLGWGGIQRTSWVQYPCSLRVLAFDIDHISFWSFYFSLTSIFVFMFSAVVESGLGKLLHTGLMVWLPT